MDDGYNFIYAASKSFILEEIDKRIAYFLENLKKDDVELYLLTEYEAFVYEGMAVFVIVVIIFRGVIWEVGDRGGKDVEGSMIDKFYFEVEVASIVFYIITVRMVNIETRLNNVSRVFSIIV